MKRYFLMGFCLVLLLLSLSGCKNQQVQELPGDQITEQTAYGPLKWGMTEEEVFVALSIREEQVLERETIYRGYAVSVAWDQPVYGLKLDSLDFNFDAFEGYSRDSVPRLVNLGFTYPEDTELTDIWDSLTEVYKKSPAFSVTEEYPENNSYTTWAKTNHTLSSELTQPAKDAMRELFKESMYADEENWDPYLEGAPLVEIISIEKDTLVRSKHSVRVKGEWAQIANILNARYPDSYSR